MIQPLAPRRYEIRVTVSEETHAALCQLQGLLAAQVPGGDPAAIIERALGELLEETLAKKAALTDRPRKGKPQQKRSRHIPAAIRRAVWLRDQGRCAHTDARGRRCSGNRYLEFHHLDNWARGADHDVDRIELRCRAHNQYQAALDYGAAFMATKRRSTATRAREPQLVYPIARRATEVAGDCHRPRPGDCQPPPRSGDHHHRPRPGDCQPPATLRRLLGPGAAVPSSRRSWPTGSPAATRPRPVVAGVAGDCDRSRLPASG